MEDYLQEKQSVLLLKEELELNIKITNDYLNYAIANNMEKIDTRKRRNLKFIDNNWQEHKDKIIMIKDGFFSKRITKMYNMFFMINNLYGYLPIEAVNETKKMIDELINDLNDYLKFLNMLNGV